MQKSDLLLLKKSIRQAIHALDLAPYANPKVVMEYAGNSGFVIQLINIFCNNS